jgi:hypothetical protein
VVPARYDAFRLHVSPSYREQFDRAVNQILQRKGWHIVRTKARRSAPSPFAIDRPETSGVDELLIGLSEHV